MIRTIFLFLLGASCFRALSANTAGLLPPEDNGPIYLGSPPMPQTHKTDDSELGRYKEMFHAKVGAAWSPQVDLNFRKLSRGTVDIQFTIHADGRVETKLLSST